MILFAATTIMVAASFSFSALGTQASTSPEQEAEQVVARYIDAMIAQDAEKAANYVKNFSYKDEADTIAGYQELFKDNPVYSYKILSVQLNNATNATVALESTDKLGGTKQVNLKAAKIRSKWYVINNKSFSSPPLGYPPVDFLVGEDGQIYLQNKGQ